MKITKKFVKSNVNLHSALPGSTMSLISFSAATDEQAGFDRYGNPESVRERMMKNMEKWGWIEYRGCAVLTVAGYKSMN